LGKKQEIDNSESSNDSQDERINNK